MSLYDLVTIALAVLLVLHGRRAGAVGILLTTLGLALGLLLAVRFSATVAGWLAHVSVVPPGARDAVAFLIIFALTVLATSMLVAPLRRLSVGGGVLGRLNRVGGALLGAGLAVVAVCLVTAALLALPPRAVPFSASLYGSGSAPLARALVPGWEQTILPLLRSYLPDSVGRESPTGSRPSSSKTARIADRVAPGLVDINVTFASDTVGAATGMVLTSTGTVLTNYHVIDGATGIIASSVDDGRTYSAGVVGYDRGADVAVLRLQDASGLETVPLGDSSTVREGDGVVALGNAGGRGGAPSVSSGEITALRRTVRAFDTPGNDARVLHGLFETNARIRPGDSGGALVSRAGRVIGMNAAASLLRIGPRTLRRGFAIPIDQALNVARRIERAARS
jgi:S1-C subfamily serine protease